MYDWVDVSPEWIDRLRIPPPVHLYLLVVLIVAALPQRSVRPFILYTGLVCLWLFLGLPFALCVIAACLIIYWITQPLARWAQRSNRPAWPTGIGWAAIHLMFLPCFFITLPFVPDMQPGEITQFCGIGFMVLKASQFVFDSCRGKLPNVRWDQFLTFMTFLPTFRLGPVDNCRHFIDELESCKSRIDYHGIVYGFYRIAVGTAKMLVVLLWIEPRFFPDPYNIPFGQQFFNDATNDPIGTVWIKAYMFYFRLFFIFSGYSDGAIGMSRIMGIRTPENFRYPLLATNLVDFWRRWHISMGVWLRDYIYIPLGGYRNPILATAVVFAYCGLWHFPAYWAPGFFVIVQTTSITITRKWRARQKARGIEVPQAANGIRARVLAVLGWALTQHIMVFTALCLLDHIHSGLRVMGRMFGL